LRRITRAFACLTCLALVAAFAGCAKDRSTETDAELGLNAQEAAGRRVFQEHCAVCHSAYTSTGDHGPGLNGLFRKQFLPSGMPANERFVRQTILGGRGMMPPQGEVLTEQQIDDVVAYLHTL
jgi:mono/diheme cytochrome c family protein